MKKYSEAVHFLSQKNEAGSICSKILLCSIDENETLLFDLLKVKKKTFRPSIPHLIYQYSFYTNYDNEDLNKINEEIGY